MALVFKDRVKETTATTGTVTVTLAGASAGFQSFSVIGDTNTTYYTLVSGSDWEVGIGTYTSSGTTLSRDTVLESSNAGSKISLAGTSDVFCTYPAEKAVVQDETNTAYVPQIAASNGVSLTKNNISSNFTIPTDYNGFAVGPQTVDSGVAFTIPSGSRYIVI
tara:strand:+ start:205 stop:693 length:489 start_codon:yes stop_codon:yes gene_type:complete